MQKFGFNVWLLKCFRLGEQATRAPIRYNRVFGPTSTQEQVYSHIKKDISNIIEGMHVAVMAYGQTGTGKTHTMLGQRGAKSNQVVWLMFTRVISSNYNLLLLVGGVGILIHIRVFIQSSARSTE